MQLKVCKNNFKESIYQLNQSIDVNKYEQSTVILTTTFPKPAGEVNPYVWFEYSWQKNFKHTRVQVSWSMNSDPINANKQVNNIGQK